jgi:hypothetical protein
MSLDQLEQIRLNADGDWERLKRAIAAEGDTRAVDALIRTLRLANVTSAILELEYLDQDFSADFSAFYSKLFRRYSKVCRRLHFFTEDVQSVFKLKSATEIATELQRIGDCGGYFGFAVLRPLKHARLGQVVLSTPDSPTGTLSSVLVAARYEVHLLGARLSVHGAPYTQQDQRIGACAQASIWAAGRHFHTKHGAARFSMAEVAEAASKPADGVLAASLPAGSKFLSPDNMVRALTAMGREPLMFSAVHDYKSGRWFWPAGLQPHRIINQYVDSGIPVIIGLSFPDLQVGHAVIAVGQNVKTVNPDNALPPTPTRADLLDAFLVNDDQLGIYLRMPIKAASTSGQTPYNVEANVSYLIIPLPKKVYMPAEVAEKLAWDLLRKYLAEWPSYRSKHKHKSEFPVEIGDTFHAAATDNKIVARTYLTWGWKYRHRTLRSSAAPGLKGAILSHALPKFVWVTEFGTLSSLNYLKIEDCRIYSHAVTDATSSDFPEARSIFHAPGLVHRWYHDPKDDRKEYIQAEAILMNDALYEPKVRGRI